MALVGRLDQKQSEKGLKTMTPDQKRRAFKRKQFTAVTTAQRHLFASVYGVTSVQPHNHSGGKVSLNIREVEAVCDTIIFTT